MSHWTTVETEITDTKRLEEALGDLKMKFTKKGNELILDGSQGYFKIVKGENGKYKFVCDYYYGNNYGFNQSMEKKIINRYTFRKAISEARKKGFLVSNEKVKPDGSIVFKLKKIG